jgi:Flp pilus assembly pilin Flp
MQVCKTISAFLREHDRGQDVAEYCLITAGIALVGLGIILYFSGGLQGIWTSINNTLAAGNSGSTSGGGLAGGH